MFYVPMAHLVRFDSVEHRLAQKAESEDEVCGHTREERVDGRFVPGQEEHLERR